MFSFESLGVSIAYLVAIVSVTETIKKVDKKKLLKKFYVWVPLLLSLIISLIITEPFSLKVFALTALTYVGLSSYGYTFIKKNLDVFLKKD